MKIQKVQIPQIEKSVAMEMPSQSDLAFLDLSGRKLFYNQGYYGQNVIVAVVDTGVSNHVELQGKLLQGRNFCWNYSDPNNSNDDDGHGTHVAATIAGSLVGIAPQVKILPVKVLSPVGGDIPDLIEGLKWIKDWSSSDGKKVDIVSMSLICPDSQYTEELHKAVKDLVNNNITVIAAAGNTGTETILYPSGFYEPICVGAVNYDMDIAYFTTRNNEVDLCQVGVDVISANYKGGYVKFSGTSMATPIVSGIAALICSKYKALFGKSIPEPVLYEMLKTNTIDIGIPGVDMQSGAGFCTLAGRVPTEIKINEYSDIAYVNGKSVQMDNKPVRINDRLNVPIRFISENFGAVVEWDEESATATIKL